MRIGIISDTHDDQGCIAAAIAQFRARQIDMLLHAGDCTRPESLSPFSGLHIPVEAVFGNCDRFREALAAAMSGWGTIFEGPRRIAVPGAVIVLMHEPQVSSDGDIIVSGHTHVPAVTREGRQLSINPGECSGRRHGHPTIAVLSLPDRSVEIIPAYAIEREHGDAGGRADFGEKL